MTSIPALSDGDLTELRERAGRTCIVYQNHDLPRGCAPSVGRVGVEHVGGLVHLHVDRSVRYAGSDPEVAAWVGSGTHIFATFEDMLQWLRDRAIPTSAAPTAARATDPIFDLDQVVYEPGDSRTLVDPVALESAIRTEVIGQTEAVRKLTGDIARHLSKERPRKPLCLLLMGATGTGKTLFAERAASALTELTDTEWRLLRYDMNEFSERHAVSRLLGAPPGYVGHGSGSSLATELAAHPNCVIMFDEIDKAHPEVLIALMNLMDKGRLGNTDGAQPAAVSSILLFTSNLAVNTSGDSSPQSVFDLEHAARQALLAHGTRPEIVARFANICMFTPLTGRDRAFVAARSVKRVAEDYGVAVTSIDPAYLSGLLKRTRASRIGVRGLEYLVDADLGEQLAKRALGDNVEVIGSEPQIRTTPPMPTSHSRSRAKPDSADLTATPLQES